MTDWTYYASPSRASLEDGVAIARRFAVMWRGSRNSANALIANVGRLRPGDDLHFVFREPSHCRYAFKARIGKPVSPAPGTAVIDRVGGAAAAELIGAGYPALSDGSVEVIHLLDLDEDVEADEIRPPPNQMAIWRGVPSGASPGSSSRRVVPSRQPTHGDRSGLMRSVTATELELQATPTLRGAATFDRYLAVDWSASSAPARGRDSIWIAEGAWGSDGEWHEEVAANCATRQEALAHLLRRLSGPGRVLVGFDFAFGYSAGFADLVASGGDGPPWLRTARLLEQSLRDSPRNANNRHEVATTLNRRIGGGPGPFWGCRSGAESECLKPRRVGLFQFPYRGLEEFRLTDHRVRSAGTSPVSVWKIDQGVSVGGQTLIGIAYLMRLRESLRNAGRSFAIWPFETGWSAGSADVTAVEMFPSLVASKTFTDSIKDRHQVRQCIERFGSLDSAGGLVGSFGRPAGLDDEGERRAQLEEGWIFLA